MTEGEKPGAPPEAVPPAPIQPLPVTVIGVRSEGTGAPITNGQVIQTPDHQPNLVVKVVTPIVAIVIRFANAYLTALLGLVTVGLTTDAIAAPDFLHLVERCAGLALAGPCVALAKDLITILSGLERKYPLATGSV